MTQETNLFPREYRDLAWVPRWGIARVMRRQSVAEHSYFVSLYCSLVSEFLGLPTEDRLILITSALHHDQAECYTGDTPGPVKHATVDKEVLAQYEKTNDKYRFGDTPEIPPERKDLKLLLKVCDLLEETAYLNGEIQQGNKAVEHMEEASRKRLYLKLDEYAAEVAMVPGDKLRLVSEIHNSLEEERKLTSKGVVDLRAL